MGNIDGIKQDSSGNVSVYGWACNSGSPAPIYVDLYANAPYPSGKMLGRFPANLSSEPGVAQACSSYGSTYRFSIPLQSQWRSQYPGSSVYIYGISPTGGWNLLLSGSGNFKITPLAFTGPTFSPWLNEPYVIGAWYFGMWSRLNVYQANQSQLNLKRFDPWGGVRDWYLNPSQAPQDYAARKPQIGFYDQLDQRVMDTHIQQAASRGLSYFAFYWYWDVDRQEEYYPNSVAVYKFLSSTYKSKLKFMISTMAIRGGASTITWDTWKNRLVPYLVNTFITDPSYLTTADGRPIITDWDFGLPASLHKQGIQYLRDYVIAKTGMNPLILGISDDIKDTAGASAAITNNGIDGFQTFVKDMLSQGWPESYDVSVSRWTNQILQGTGYFQMLGTVSAWDPRPWNLLKFGQPYTTYNSNMSTGAFGAHLNQMRNYLDQNPATTAKMLTIYAWNEWGEGGAIEPDVRYGTGYIDTIQGVFGLAPRSANPSVLNLEATYPATGVAVNPYNTLIQDIIKTYLNRAAGASEVAWWANVIQNNLLPKTDIINAILSSTEYAATWKSQLSTAAGRITLTYNQMMGRNPTTSEMTYWTPYAMNSLSIMQGSLLFSSAHQAYDPILYPTYGTAPQVGLKTTDILRLRKGADYLYTNSFDEAVSAQMNYGYTFENRSFSILQSPLSGMTQPLVRCRTLSAGVHFMSTSSTCEGQVIDGTLGYIYSNAATGTVGLARYRGPASYIYPLTNSSEISVVQQLKFIYEGITGYVLP